MTVLSAKTERTRLNRPVQTGAKQIQNHITHVAETRNCVEAVRLTTEQRNSGPKGVDRDAGQQQHTGEGILLGECRLTREYLLSDHLSLRPNLGAIAFIGLFSVFVNLLMLTGPLFMLQIYDRVLASRSEATLIALFVLVVGLYSAMALLDFVRGRVGARIGARMQADLDPVVFAAVLRAPPQLAKEAATGLSDLESVRRFCSSPVAFALFDAPFTPLFIAAIFIFHPLLGWLAVAGGGTLLVISLINQWVSRKPGASAAQTAAQAARISEQIRTEPETIRSLGMTMPAIAKWQSHRGKALQADIALSDRNGGFGSLTKALRLFLQSAMLALGAWLVLREQLTPGAMIAASILLGRALAPVEQIIGSWAIVGRARQGWHSLHVLLSQAPEPAPRTRLHRPNARLSVRNLTVLSPTDRTRVLNDICFDIAPGQAVGVVGESAAGKSSLARVLTGLWRPAAGAVRLDGASLEHFSEEDLARYVGYLPQEVVLFDGTIAENIARLQPNADADEIIKAAEAAGAHEMILNLPDGYDSVIGNGQTRLSGGQKQRIGLARAMFGEPVVLVLDEPNSNLDSVGSDALNAAIRTRKAAGQIVIVMAHRPAAISECDLILMLRGGQVVAFGPRDEVLRKMVKNYANIATAEAGVRAP
jgi:PrtD family type I secretion system ABC transporter